LELTIRKMRLEDMAGVSELLSKWNMAPVDPTPDNPDPERSSINIEHSFVALDGNKIVGVGSYIILSPVTAETASLAVDPDYQSKGIGYKLQKLRLREMKQRGIMKVRTETDRPETIDWYVRKFGYKVVGINPKKHAFSLPGVDSWTVLELDLDKYEV
jgi:N-acetylglutamate synthase-like GNAT family acetyltransferase